MRHVVYEFKKIDQTSDFALVPVNPELHILDQMLPKKRRCILNKQFTHQKGILGYGKLNDSIVPTGNPDPYSGAEITFLLRT